MYSNEDLSIMEMFSLEMTAPLTVEKAVLFYLRQKLPKPTVIYQGSKSDIYIPAYTNNTLSVIYLQMSF